MTRLAPLEIYYSQYSISNRFGKYTPHRNKTIGETLDDILSGKCEIYGLPTISVTKKNGLWVSADNRRLWVYKKLQEFGKCDTIPVFVTHHLSSSKNCIQRSIRVRGHEGGTLWRTMKREQRTDSCLSIQQNLNSLTRLTPQSLQRETSIDSIARSIENHPISKTSLDTPLRMSSYGESVIRRVSQFDRDGVGQSTNTSTSSCAEQTLIVHSHLTNSGNRVYDSARESETPTVQTSEAIYTSQTNSPYVIRKMTVDDGRTRQNVLCRTRPFTSGNIQSSTQEYASRGSEISSSTIVNRFSQTRLGTSTQSSRPSQMGLETRISSPRSSGMGLDTSMPSSSYQDQEIVHLEPLDVGFANDSYAISFDGKQIGEYLDKYLPKALDRTLIFPIKVFQYKGKYYSENNLGLWAIQSLHRFSGNIKLSGYLVAQPASGARLCNSLRSFDKVEGNIWKKCTMLNNLSTKESKMLNLSDIVYSRTHISDTYQGESIMKRVIEIYSAKSQNMELNVVEYNNKYYALENQRLWILKQVEVVLGPLTITGNVKVCMDGIMFQSFTADSIRDVDIVQSGFGHTREEMFMMEYIKKIHSRKALPV